MKKALTVMVICVILLNLALSIKADDNKLLLLSKEYWNGRTNEQQTELVLGSLLGSCGLAFNLIRDNHIDSSTVEPYLYFDVVIRDIIYSIDLVYYLPEYREYPLSYLLTNLTIVMGEIDRKYNDSYFDEFDRNWIETH